MSRRSQQEFTCPVCKKTSHFTVWDCINTSIDPQMKQAVRDGSAFLFTCPHCGKDIQLQYDFLYHQMEDRIMIHVVRTAENVQEDMEMISGIKDYDMLIPGLRENGYLMRVVRSQKDLQEKLQIFDIGQDDRLVEIYKIFLLARYQERHPKFKKTELLYFHGDDENQGMIVLGDSKLGVVFEIEQKLYQDISDLYLPLMKDIRDEDPIVDRKWALHFFKEHSTILGKDELHKLMK